MLVRHFAEMYITEEYLKTTARNIPSLSLHSHHFHYLHCANTLIMNCPLFFSPSCINAAAYWPTRSASYSSIKWKLYISVYKRCQKLTAETFITSSRY